MLGEYPALKDISSNTISIVKDAFSFSLDVGPDTYLDDDEVETAITEIVKRLLDEFPGRATKVPEPDALKVDWWMNNPFGAELSTLIRMEKDLHLPPPKGKRPPHRIVLLASQTRAGLVARRILYGNLTSEAAYNFAPVENDAGAGVKEEMVRGLSEVTLDPVSAERELVRVIRTNLLPKKDGWRNLFLVTGGFKSVLPCMTMLSLLYGVEMVYLFEHSPALQRFQLVQAKTDDKVMQWRDVWVDLHKKGKLIPAGCLDAIIQDWSRPDSEAPEPIFG